MGTRKVGYAIVSLGEVIKAKALPPQTSAQKAELIALMRALQLGKDRQLNTFTDSKYGFHVLHAHAAIWKERGMLTAKNSPIKHKDLILALLEAVQLLTQVAVIPCRGHQRDGSFVSQGNSKADQIAKQAVQLQEPEQVMALVIGPPELPSLPQYSPQELD
ncbi:ribonuclease H-like [Mesoplodon densirostris]|uniref:ribonuclease H-like n=1 Tax=Mesoplodon densirostris TaxID=48708 RepID=UPI0028DCC2BD|nr:ribonuclease H-like [Mesoplodon densirostris]